MLPLHLTKWDQLGKKISTLTVGTKLVGSFQVIALSSIYWSLPPSSLSRNLGWKIHWRQQTLFLLIFHVHIWLYTLWLKKWKWNNLLAWKLLNSYQDPMRMLKSSHRENCVWSHPSHFPWVNYSHSFSYAHNVYISLILKHLKIGSNVNINSVPLCDKVTSWPSHCVTWSF